MHARLKAAALGVSVLGALALAAGTAGASVTPKATTVCANSSPTCLNISNLFQNQDNAPQFVLNATNGQSAIGRRLNTRQASDTRTNQDFIVHAVGTLSQLCPNLNPGAPIGGVNALDPTSYACLHMDVLDNVYQANFAPNSNETGQCAGALAATEGFKLRLVRCGDPRSFWVGDLNGSEKITVTEPGGNPHELFYFPLEFAADHAASNPLVATFQPDSTNPVNKVTLQQENESGGHAIDRQMWTFTNQAGFTPGIRN